MLRPETSPAPISTFALLKEAVGRTWRLVMLGAWGLVGVWLTVRDELLAEEYQRYTLKWFLRQSPWEWWVILFLVSTVLIVVFGYHRAYVRVVTGLINTHSGQVTDLQTRLDETTKLLEEEKTKPMLKGQFHQVYIDDVHLSDYVGDDHNVGFFVTVQVSMWNVRKTPTSVNEFSLRASTSIGEFRGRWVTGAGYAYFGKATFATKYKETIYPLDVWDLPRSPIPYGYTQGVIEREKWLRFKVTDLDIDDVFATEGDWQSHVNKIVLVATDSFGIEHDVASGEPPWITKGKVDFQSIKRDMEYVLALLTSLSNSGSEFYSRCMAGGSSERLESEIADWEGKVATFLDENFDSAHRAVFINAPIDPSFLPNRTAKQSYLINWVKIRLQKLNEIIERERERNS